GGVAIVSRFRLVHIRAQGFAGSKRRGCCRGGPAPSPPCGSRPATRDDSIRWYPPLSGSGAAYTAPPSETCARCRHFNRGAQDRRRKLRQNVADPVQSATMDNNKRCYCLTPCQGTRGCPAASRSAASGSFLPM